ncbi:hypothetical protein CTI14_54925, partial [Methylobacterium radiotolerans]
MRLVRLIRRREILRVALADRAGILDTEALADSRLIADLLEVSPESVKWLGNDSDLEPLPLEAQWQEIQSKISRHAEPAAAMRLVRLIRRREILRVALADRAGILDTEA